MPEGQICLFRVGVRQAAGRDASAHESGRGVGGQGRATIERAGYGRRDKRVVNEDGTKRRGEPKKHVPPPLQGTAPATKNLCTRGASEAREKAAPTALCPAAGAAPQGANANS